MEKYFQISTAIDYPSGNPHLGHLYEKVCTDVIARWKRLEGFKVHFSTGTDEHGLKIRRAAKKVKKTPKQFVDEMSKRFKRLCECYNISFDDFIRTTEKRHEKSFLDIFEKIKKKGYIYEGKYKGPYCVECETYYTEKDLIDKRDCPIHKKTIEIIEEEGYFFKLSEFQNRLIDYYKKNLDFIYPKKRKNQVLGILKEPLKDLSITRKSSKWGIEVPGKRDLVVSVWTEALWNYLTTIGYPNSKYKKYWPGNHVIGHDIVYHHTILFDSWLLAAGLKLPNVIVHGFINIKGEKMSKSGGSIVDPFKLAEKYSVDNIRYYLIKNIAFGDDGDFSERKLKDSLNNELANDLGNLVSRTLTLVERHFDGKLKKQKNDNLVSKFSLEKVKKYIENYELHNALSEIWKFVNELNKYVNRKEPWKNEKNREIILYNLLEGIRISSIVLEPFIPNTTEKINKQLNVTKGSLKDIKFGIVKEYEINKEEILFRKIK